MSFVSCISDGAEVCVPCIAWQTEGLMEQTSFILGFAETNWFHSMLPSITEWKHESHYQLASTDFQIGAHRGCVILHGIQSHSQGLCGSAWNPEPFTDAVFREIKYVICPQYLLKTNRKSESEKAQQGILVATEHLPQENVVMVMLSVLLTITLELALKLNTRLCTTLLKDC